MDIVIEPPTRADVIALLNQHLENMRQISPPESVHALDLDGLCAPAVTFWTARRNGSLLGCGALKALGAEYGEIKSMRTADEYRGQGVARAILASVIAQARARVQYSGQMSICKSCAYTSVKIAKTEGRPFLGCSAIQPPTLVFLQQKVEQHTELCNTGFCVCWVDGG